jgi:hypothetical protein
MLSSYTLLADELANTAVGLGSLVRGVAGSKRAENHEHGHDDCGQNHQLAENRAGVAKLLPLHAALSQVFLQLLRTQLVVDETSERNGVAECLKRGDRILEEEHGGEDEEDVLEYTRKGQDEGRSLANQEHNRHVEHESNERVRKQGKTTNTVDVLHGELGELSEEQHKAVHASASWGVVVERDEGVHLELGGAQQALHHDQTDSLEGNAAGLEQETSHDELDLSHGGNDHTNDDEGNIAQGLHVQGSDTEDGGGNQDSDGHGGLEGISNSIVSLALAAHTLSI